NARFIKPLDTLCLDRLAELKKPIIVYETDMLAGGLSSAILEWSCDTGKPLALHRIGIEDKFVDFGSIPQLRKNTKIDINSLFNLIQSVIG
ncbi:MAG: 1-deoxy-D-xylulose-5-phosphate synthase, partial [Erysipelotrichales bacterium]